MNYDLRQVHVEVQDIVRRVIQEELTEKVGHIRETMTKKGAASQSLYVTKEDIHVDKKLRQALLAAYPEVGFVSEESKSKTQREYNWVIDPIDGTGNFSHGLPFYGVSVGLWLGNDPLYGTIHLPGLDTHVYAIAGEGVFEGEQKIEPMTQPVLHPYCLYAPVGSAEEVARVYRVIGETLGHPRDFGCCVYQAVLVCKGQADVFVGYQLSLWDIGVIVLMAKELGMPIQWLSAAPDLSSYEDGRQYSFVFGRAQRLIEGVDALKKVL
jgi:myo-inositol-1(or 4)-monophosphatase